MDDLDTNLDEESRRERRNRAFCQCDEPSDTRTLAKGTPAEKVYCNDCGNRIRD